MQISVPTPFLFYDRFFLQYRNKPLARLPLFVYIGSQHAPPRLACCSDKNAGSHFVVLSWLAALLLPPTHHHHTTVGRVVGHFEDRDIVTLSTRVETNKVYKHDKREYIKVYNQTE